MQSILSYGRVVTRALVSGVCSYSTGEGSTVSRCKRDRALRLHAAPCGFPKVFNGQASLMRKGQFGDDACFIANYKCTDVLGVADGVGGWRSYGVDPSMFAFSLMKTCERLVKTGRFNPRMPADILASSYYELLESKQQIIGSSTACVLVLNHLDCMIYTANIGDSGFLIVRQGKVVHRSEEQQHYFNTPFQLSLPPPGVRVLRDSPDSASTSSFPVQEGDVILVATDGVFDNISETMIVNEVSRLKEMKMKNIQQCANSLAFQAHRLSFDSTYMSPFALRAQKNGIPTIGGKPDDITVLVAYVGLKEVSATDMADHISMTQACSDYG